MNIGATVAVLEHAGNPRRVRKGEENAEGRYGQVVYVSPRGWATVRLDNGYPESFWVDRLVPIHSEEELA